MVIYSGIGMSRRCKFAAPLRSQACWRCGDTYSVKRLPRKQFERMPYVECTDGETCVRRVLQLQLMGILVRPERALRQGSRTRGRPAHTLDRPTTRRRWSWLQKGACEFWY